MDVYIVSRSLKPSVGELPGLLNFYRPFRRVNHGTVLVTDYMEIGGLYVTGVDIHDDEIYVEDTIVFVIGPESPRDTIVEARISQMVRAIADYRKGLLTEVTWMSDEISTSKIEINGKYKYEGADYDSLEAAYAVRSEALNSVTP